MSGLFGSLDVALQSLLTQQGALRATTANIANLNTPGFSRRRPVISEEIPVFEGGMLLGRGARLDSIESVRDRVLELRIASETQRQSATEAFVSSMSSVETLVGDGDDSLGSRVQALFNSLNQLSTSPADTSLRQGVLIAAGDLARAFRTIYGSLQEHRAQLDRSVVQSINETNRLIAAIAAVNREVAARTALGQEPGALEDQRTELVKQLSSRLDVSATETPDGLTLTTVHGEPLVVAGQSFEIKTVTEGGTQHVYAGDHDITADLQGGELGGLLRARDQEIGSLLNSLDDFAFSLATALNTAHRAGVDLSGNTGGDLFTVGTTSAGSAGNISLALTDAKALAASSDASVGGNGNLLNLCAIRDSGVIHGQTPSEAYSSLVFQVGGAIANAKADQQAGEVVLTHLQDLRGSISSVNLDEESANLIRFQQAYQASARVIQAINEMLDVAVNLGRT